MLANVGKETYDIEEASSVSKVYLLLFHLVSYRIEIDVYWKYSPVSKFLKTITYVCTNSRANAGSQRQTNLGEPLDTSRTPILHTSTFMGMIHDH